MNYKKNYLVNNNKNILKSNNNFFFIYIFKDEFKGHSLLEACRIADVSKVKKLLNSDIAKFKHPLTGDTAFVSYIHHVFYI